MESGLKTNAYKNRHIVFFKGKLDVLDYFIDQLLKGADNLGVDYYVADVNDPNTYNCEEFHWFLKQEGCVAFLINQIGMKLMASGDITTWELHNVPVYSFIQDHPRNFDDALTEPIKDFHAIVLDRTHETFIKKIYPKVGSIHFMPNGGTPVYHPVPEYDDREIELLYTGSAGMVVNGFPPIPFLKNNGTDFYEFTLGLMSHQSQWTTEDAITLYFSNRDDSCSPEEMRSLLLDHSLLIESAVRRNYKLNIMHMLDDAGFSIEIFGSDWITPEMPFGNKIHIHDRISPGECNNLIGRSKLVLSFMPWHKDGCSERVFNNMLNGAVCITDPSVYLKDRFTNWKNIVFYDLNRPQELIDIIRELQDNPKKAAEIASEGYKIAIENDTWEHRLQTVLRFMEEDGI